MLKQFLRRTGLSAPNEIVIIHIKYSQKCINSKMLPFFSREQDSRNSLQIDKFAVWDQCADKSKGLPALQNPALRDMQYIPNTLPKTKKKKKKRRTNNNKQNNKENQQEP